MIKLLSAILFIAFVTGGVYQIAPDARPTSTPYPTATDYPAHGPWPTATDYPTQAPYPTSTPYPVQASYPTQTLYPTQAPLPTYTATPICLVNQGLTIMQDWSVPNIPGGLNQVENLSTTFANSDAYGLPWRSTPANTFYHAAFSYGRGGPMASIQEGWIAIPGNSVKLQVTAGGNLSSGLYIGSSRIGSTRVAWNLSGIPAQTFDVSSFPLVCGKRLMYARIYLADSYNVNNTNLQWDVGAGFVNIPTSEFYGAEPFTLDHPPTSTPTPTFTRTPTPTRTPTNTSTSTQTPTNTPTPIPTDAPTPLPPTETPTPVPTDTETPVPTDTETPVPTDTETPTETPTP